VELAEGLASSRRVFVASRTYSRGKGTSWGWRGRRGGVPTESGALEPRGAVCDVAFLVTQFCCKGNRWELGRGPQRALWGSEGNILETD
jgi:hypothetical protein